jgi:two-component system sensor histidine kinase PilS (NtrC family)
LIAIAYATQAVVLWMLPRFRQEDAGHDPLTRGQWLATIGVDLITFSLLHWMQPTQNFNFVALLLLPVLMGGVLATRTVALAGSSAVVLILLAVTWNVVAHAGGAATLWMQAGLAGVGFFAVTLLAGEMATRLKNQADAARGGLELARQQAQLNRLVIEEMTDGVMVVDRRSRVRAANPAARRLLVREGMGRAAPFQLQDDRSWAELQQLVNQAFERKAWVGSENNATLKFADGMTRTLRVRGRFTRRRSASTKGAADLRDGPREKLRSEVFCVVFLEDQRQVLDRNRQEKLAAMGRVSAGIAHEIRNPLAAIAQANALMMEEAQGREQAMLTRMIHENVERLKMIVDDVMAVAPSRGGVEPRIEAVSVVQRIVAEWSQSAGLSPGLSGARASGLPGATDGRLSIEVVPDRLPVIFDAEHLRRVLVNLLDNARRHATNTPGAFVLRLTASSDEHAVLSVASDGEAIAADVEPFLFEPFFSSRSRGTGLGLYICRELCERYGATIDYWAHPPESRHRNEFRVVLRRTDRADLGDQLPSDPQLLT